MLYSFSRVKVRLHNSFCLFCLFGRHVTNSNHILNQLVYNIRCVLGCLGQKILLKEVNEREREMNDCVL